MPASASDYFQKVARSTATTLSSPGYTVGNTSINVASTSNWPTDTGITFAIDEVDSDGVRIAGTYNIFRGVVSSATQISSLTYEGGDANRDYSAGATTRVYILVSYAQTNRLIDGILEFANQDGTLIQSAVQDALGVTSLPAGGWEILNSGQAPTVSTGYNKGNREYDLTFANVDLSSTLSPGMRLKLDRTGTTPTQCTDLEASSSQYWSKTSPTGITFTDDFTCEAWIKLESYTGSEMAIVGRRNASTEGWEMRVGTAGQLEIAALRIASNNKIITTNQSIPLNRWVHVAATMDLSSNTYTTYIDGVSVSNSIVTNGTITALVQGTTALTVGARNTPTSYFDGEISDVRVWSAIRTATQIRDNMNQQLVGNETNLVAYFKFNGDANDSTSNANNLSASGSATATTVDHPMKSTEYAIITKVSYSAPNTTVTVFTGTDHNIPNMTLANPFYSTQKAPYGFPAGRNRWVVETVISSTSGTTATAGTIYNLGSNKLVLPTGDWRIAYDGHLQHDNTSASGFFAGAGLSTQTNAFSDFRLIQTAYIRTSSTSASIQGVNVAGFASVTTATDYYLVGRIETGAGTITIAVPGGSVIGYSNIVAECAYL